MKRKNKLKCEWVNRTDFVEERYQNYKKKKVFLEQHYPRDSYILSDLDSEAIPGVLLRDVVVCDACNENIEDPAFVMMEKSSVYHDQCAKTYDGYEPLSRDLRVIVGKHTEEKK